ncbi:Transmembrane protein 247 [Plecturocebus cupreus]
MEAVQGHLNRCPPSPALPPKARRAMDPNLQSCPQPLGPSTMPRWSWRRCAWSLSSRGSSTCMRRTSGRQHEVVMEQLQREAAPHLGSIVPSLDEDDDLRSHTGRDRARLNLDLPGAKTGITSSTVFSPPQFSGGLQDLLLPQNQFAMFLYCFIFIHIIYVTKEMVFFLFSKHYLFCIATILLCLIKTFWSYFQVPLLSSSLGPLTPAMLECYQCVIPASRHLLFSLCASVQSESTLRKGRAAQHFHLRVKKHVHAP